MRHLSVRFVWPLLLALLLCFGTAPGAFAKDPPKGKPGDPGVPDRKLQKQINKAIDSGADWLRKQQKISGLIGSMSIHGGIHYQVGTTALAGMALLAAGDKPDPKGGRGEVDKALAFCRKRTDKAMGGTLTTTYDTGTTLMFATKYFRAAGKKRSGKKDRYGLQDGKGGPCSIPDKAAGDWIQSMADWIVSKQKPTGGWGYPDRREDWSNTQYALLGLRAAHDCGARIPPAVFMKAIKRALQLQEQDGPKVKRIIRSATGTGHTYVIDGGDRARGWGYLARDKVNATGSMTTSGIAILAIGHNALTKPRHFRPYDLKMQKQVQRAVQDGFAWLNFNFAVDKNPPPGAPAWHYYYLYGLERACVFGGRNLLGENDWYIEGAKYLVANQHKEGKWSTGVLGAKDVEPSDVVDTAWAILFLARATRPAPPIKAPVVTGK